VSERPTAGRSRALGATLLLWLAGAALLADSCAYYNTYYLARKYYDRATGGLPYPVEKPDPTASQNFTRAIDYSKKVIGNYPKSKWVDDAYLMWARALLGQDDPRQTVNMLQDFSTRYPKSPLKNDATFYLGVGYRQARKYNEALRALDDFIAQSPKNDLIPYAFLERSRTLSALDRPAEAAGAAGRVVDKYPKSKLHDQALLARADALFAEGSFDSARVDYHSLGVGSRNDVERFTYLLRESDCLEGARRFDTAVALLRDALSHESRPPEVDTLRSGRTAMPGVVTNERYGRLLLRIGSVYTQSGRKQEALDAFQSVLRYYPRTSLGAEAQYRIGYTYETVADDFDRARAEYAKVKSHQSSGAFVSQADGRLDNLDRIARYRSAGSDSTDKKVEAGFLLAEIYLFQLDKPDRALTEYRKLALAYPKTPYAAKARTAEAWVLRHKFDRPAEADSILWYVVHNDPATEAQLAARDYLEAVGQKVPTELIKMPEVHYAAVDTTVLRRPPDAVAPIGTTSPLAQRGGLPDSLVGPRLPAPRGFAVPPQAGLVGPPARYHPSPLDDPPRPLPWMPEYVQLSPRGPGAPRPGPAPRAGLGPAARDSSAAPARAPSVPRRGGRPPQAASDSMRVHPPYAPQDTLIRRPQPPVAPPDSSVGPR